jgi:membrane protein DedA with SNARE-associated domain
MSIETIIAQFGYPALVGGLLLEGETFLVLGAFMAHRGYFDLRMVIGLGVVVSFVADQLFFALGRARGELLLARRPSWRPNVERAQRLLHRNTKLLFIGFRFMYGLRTVMPFVFGMSRFDRTRFVIFNLVGALLWSTSFGLSGYAFGEVMEIVLEDVSRYERELALAILLIGTGAVLYQRWRTPRARNQGQG